MDEIKFNSNVDSDIENSFVDDQYFDEINREENDQYELKSTLSLSEIYRKDFYHYVNIYSLKIERNSILFFSFSFIRIIMGN
jgi:hypothetical protein